MTVEISGCFPCAGVIDGGAGGVLRGGSWNNNIRNVRASNRNNNDPDNWNNNIGFRCARPLSVLTDERPGFRA